MVSGGVNPPHFIVEIPRGIFRCSWPWYISLKETCQNTITIFLPRLPVALMHFTAKESRLFTDETMNQDHPQQPSRHETALLWAFLDEMSDTTETCAGETHRRKLMNSRRKNRLPYKFLLKVHPFGQVEWTCRLVQVPPGSLKSIQISAIQTYIWRFGHIKVQMQINIPVLPRLSRNGPKHFAL